MQSMKKYFVLAAVALCSVGFVSAAAFADRPVSVEELPAYNALRSPFREGKRAREKNDGRLIVDVDQIELPVELQIEPVDDDLFNNDYKVVFADGVSVEFASNGEWKEVGTRRGVVPAAIVPPVIREQVGNLRIERVVQLLA